MMVEYFDVILIGLNSGTLFAVVRVIFMLGRSEEKHVSHDRRLTVLEKKNA